MASHVTYHVTYPPGLAGARLARARPRLARRLGGWLAVALKHVEYGRLVQALSRLPEHQLRAIGLRRAEIPAHAWRLIQRDG